MIAFSLAKENPKAPHFHNTLLWHSVGCGRQTEGTNCARILHLVCDLWRKSAQPTSQIKLLASKTPFQALRPEARSKGWFQGSVSEEHSPRRLAPNRCGDRLEKFAAKFAAKFAKKIATKFAAIFAAHFLRNSQATMILQVAATMVMQFANLRSCVIVQLACAMVQLTMCHVLCVGRNHLSMFFRGRQSFFV